MPEFLQRRKRIILPSTKSLFSEGRTTPGYSLVDFLHGYIYGRWLYFYISLGKGDHPLSRTFKPLARMWRKIRAASQLGPPPLSDPLTTPTQTVADGYHGKVITSSQAHRLVTVDQPVHIQDLEQVIPYVRARSLILEHPESLAVLDCPCRAAQAEHCLPLDVCLVVGNPFVSFMLEHHPTKSRRITQEQAEEILDSAARRGLVHHAFFKDATLGRFYAICNCCSCCCGAIKAHNRGIPMLAPSGYVARVNQQVCRGCGTCIRSCHFGAINLAGESAAISSKTCMGCGVCLRRCPQGAITLHLDREHGLPLTIRS